MNDPNYSKESIIRVMKQFIADFDHIETGKNLDQKCDYVCYFQKSYGYSFQYSTSHLLAPLFISITLLLLCTAEGQVLYFQERLGYKNKPFQIWKFATMLKNSLQLGSGSITLKDDFRVTIVGKYLRKQKLTSCHKLLIS